MKRKIMIIIGMLLTFVGNILADNLSVSDFQLSAGEEKQIAINLSNPDNQYVAFQFDLILPTGVTIAKDSKGRLLASLNEERTYDHSFTINEIGSNTFRLLAYSGTNAELDGTSGTLVNVTVKADETLGNGEFVAKINNAKFTESNGTKYSLSDVSFKIINPAPLPVIIVTATDVTRLYGDGNPTLEYTISGGTLDGEPELSCDASVTSAVGQYKIVASRGSVKNENVTFVNGTLTVEKAPLIIKADDKQMTQGDMLPEFTASYNGFKNGETESVLNKKPEFQCSATSDSPAGTYDIVPSYAEAQNYEITYQKGTLTIIPQPVPAREDSVTVDNVEMEGNSEKQIAVHLNNPNRQYVAFQFDLILPDGVTISKDEKGRFLANLNGDRTNDHSFTISEVASNTYRLLAYSGSNAEFYGTSGPIVRVILKADDSLVAGEYEAKTTAAKFTTSDGIKYSLPDTSFIINIKRGITVTAKDTSKLYGDINPNWEYTVNGGTLDGEPELSCDANATSAVGQYKIVVSRGSIKNENVTFVNGTLTIEKAPLTIKADDKQMTQGDTLPEFTASYSGFKNGETESVLNKKPEFQCSATSESETGTFDIVPSNAEAQNYEITYQKGTLTIIPKSGPDQEDKLSVDNLEMEAGGEKQVAICLNNPNRQFVAFQFDLILPDGLTVAKDNKGRFLASLNEDRTNDHTFTISEVGSNTYRLLAYSGSNAEFHETSGPIVKVTLKADDSLVAGEYKAETTAAKFTMNDGTKYTLDDVSFIIHVLSVPVPVVTITLNEDWRLFCCEQDLFFDEVGELKAYIASGSDLKQGQVIMTQISEVPAGTGVLLVGTAGKTYSIPVKEAEYVYSNFLRGVLSETSITTGYVLEGKTFQSVSSLTAIVANSAYLDLNASTKELEIILTEGVHSDINTIEGQPSDANKAWFTLQGTRLSGAPSQRGIYINKGRKAYVK